MCYLKFSTAFKKSKRLTLYGTSFQVSATMVNCTISENRAVSTKPNTLYGGGILATNGANLTMLDCNVRRNFATNEGGGLAFVGAHVHMERCLVTENHALYGGGLIVDSSSDLSCVETSFISNEADRGAGIYLGGSSTMSSFVRCTIAFNRASKGSGDGLYITYGTVYLNSSSVYNNTGSGAYFTLRSGAAYG